MTTTSTGTRLQTFAMPDVGEGLTEAEILQWRVAVGDTLAVNQIMVEIETAKAAVELPSPFAGRVHALLVEPGVTVDVGTPIITIDTDPDAEPHRRARAEPAATVDRTGQRRRRRRRREDRRDRGGRPDRDAGRVHLGRRIHHPPAAPGLPHRQLPPAAAGAPEPCRRRPPVPAGDLVAAAGRRSMRRWPRRRSASSPRTSGVDLAAVTPTRADGVISRAEVRKRLAATHSGPPAGSTGAASVRPAQPADRERRMPVKGVRKITAAAMVASAFTAPHVTEFLTIDVTRDDGTA